MADARYDQFVHDITNHPPVGPHVTERFESLVKATLSLAGTICRYVPAGREQSLALTNLEQTIMWARAGIARNQDKIPTPKGPS